MAVVTCEFLDYEQVNNLIRQFIVSIGGYIKLVNISAHDIKAFLDERGFECEVRSEAVRVMLDNGSIAQINMHMRYMGSRGGYYTGHGYTPMTDVWACADLFASFVQ